MALRIRRLYWDAYARVLGSVCKRVREPNAGWSETSGPRELLKSKDETIRILRALLQAKREVRRRIDTIMAHLTQDNAVLTARLAKLKTAPETLKLLQSREDILQSAVVGTPGPPFQAHGLAHGSETSEGHRERWCED